MVVSVPSDRGRPHRGQKPAAASSWDPLAHWYDGWVGEGGSEYHREVAIPAVMRLLELLPGDAILDLGCGQGVLAPYVARAGAHYIGVDASPRLLDLGRKRHGISGRFLLGDARRLTALRDLETGTFEAVVFLLSLQDMDPLDEALASTAWALKPGGRVVLLLTHPAFRFPRQSGWGWDEQRKLMFRRVDRYLTSLPVPMKSLPGANIQTTTRSYHRPIQDYVNGLAAHGLLTDRFEEIPAHRLKSREPGSRAETTARQEIPLFLGVRARKIRV